MKRKRVYPGCLLFLKTNKQRVRYLSSVDDLNLIVELEGSSDTIERRQVKWTDVEFLPKEKSS